VLRIRSLAFLVGLTVACSAMQLARSSAADLPWPAPRARDAAVWCGECGRLHTSYVYHRELRSTYGAGFDPRNFDLTEPYYYPGAVRAYPRYWVDAEPIR
jgi:hypothetical protein